jgi:hypothetical protein
MHLMLDFIVYAMLALGAGAMLAAAWALWRTP